MLDPALTGSKAGKSTSTSAVAFTCEAITASIGSSISSPRHAEITPANKLPSLLDFVNAKEPPDVVARFQKIAAR